MTTSDRMTPGEQRSVFVGVLVMAIMVLGMALLFSLSGCASLRKTLSATTASAELAAGVTRDVCRTLATTWCRANPCAEVLRCHQAEALLVQGASCSVEAAKLINALPREVTDGR